MKLCAQCSRNPVPTRRHTYCVVCSPSTRKRRDRRRRPELKSTSARGYGASHQALVAHWKPIVATGTVICPRCKLPIPAGAPWDLGHDDHDRTIYTGPEHRKCNRGAPARDRHDTITVRSRDW